MKQSLIELGQFLLRFGRIERATLHEDGVRKETDTDHSVMLGVISSALAEKYYPDLDRGKVAQYALVHDLVEVYAGDTPTLGITSDGKKDQIRREKEALEKIDQEFAAIPWLARTIEEYESQDTKEARFVKTLDKVMPKITHCLNGGVAWRREGYSRAQVEEMLYAQHKDIVESYGSEFKDITDLLRDLIDEAIAKAYP